MGEPDRLADAKETVADARETRFYGGGISNEHALELVGQIDWLIGQAEQVPVTVSNDLDGTHCPCVNEHNPDPAEDEVHHLVPLGAPFHGADVAANRRRLCGTQHGTVHVLLRLILRHRALGQPVPRDRIVHFSPFSRRLTGVAIRALDSGVDRPTTPDLDWVEIAWRR